MGQGLESFKDVETFWSKNYSDFKEPLEKQRDKLKLWELDGFLGKIVKRRHHEMGDFVQVGLKRDQLYDLSKTKTAKEANQMATEKRGVSPHLGYWFFQRQAGLLRQKFSMLEYTKIVKSDTKDLKTSGAELAAEILPAPKNDLNCSKKNMEISIAVDVGDADAGYVVYCWSVDARTFWMGLFGLLHRPEIDGTRFWVDCMSHNQHGDAVKLDVLRNVIKTTPRVCVCVDCHLRCLTRTWCLWEIMEATDLKKPLHFFFLGDYKHNRVILALFLTAGIVEKTDVSFCKASVKGDQERLMADIVKKHGSAEKFNVKVRKAVVAGCSEAVKHGCGDYKYRIMGTIQVLEVVAGWGVGALWSPTNGAETKFGQLLENFLYLFVVENLYHIAYEARHGKNVDVKTINWDTKEARERWDKVVADYCVNLWLPSILQHIRVRWLKQEKLDAGTLAKEAFEVCEEAQRQQASIEIGNEVSLAEMSRAVAKERDDKILSSFAPVQPKLPPKTPSQIGSVFFYQSQSGNLKTAQRGSLKKLKGVEEDDAEAPMTKSLSLEKTEEEKNNLVGEETTFTEEYSTDPEGAVSEIPDDERMPTLYEEEEKKQEA